MNTGGEPRRVLNGKRVNGSTCTPMSSLATGLSAVLGCVSVWGRSDRLGPGAQGTRACLCHGYSMDHAWSVAGDRSCPEPAEQAGETSLPAGAVPTDARPPVQATLCCPLPARWPPPPGHLRVAAVPSRPSSRFLPRPGRLRALRGGCTAHSAGGRRGARLGPRLAGEPQAFLSRFGFICPKRPTR